MTETSSIPKICSGVGIVGQLMFFVFGFFFHWPAMWYLELPTVQYTGGAYSWCGKATGFGSWSCSSIGSAEAEAFGHEWGAYMGIRVMVAFAYITGIVAIILLYVNLCVKKRGVATAGVGFAAAECLFVLIAAALCSSTFSEAFGLDTDPAYAMFMAWVAWIATILVTVMAVLALVFTIKDENKV